MPRKSFMDDACDQTKDNIVRALNVRWKLLGDCPYTPHEIYWAVIQAMGEDYRQALMLLQRTTPVLLARRLEGHLKWDGKELKLTNGTTLRWVKLELKPSMPFPPSGPAFDKPEYTAQFCVSVLPPHMQTSLHEWARRWIKLRGETTRTASKVKAAFNLCGTIGQVKRVWPILEGFMPERARSRLDRMVMQSPLPDSIKGNPEMWKPEVLAEYESIITEALCLEVPEDFNSEHEVSLITM